ncbi:MAG: DUF3971 domain-containing protein [Gammaproteobacteria bacterium]|nr:DUF3971 domain-containing protein [Gammaproteobacteria bacterium]
MTWFDKVRLYLIYTVAVILIVLAVIFSALRAALPHATGYVQELEQTLTDQIGLPVSIASMDADMYGLIPRLKLVDVVIYDKENQRELLRLDEAFFALAFVDSILQWSPIVGDISLVGADLYIERYADNRWRIQGIEFGGNVASSSTSSSANELISAIKNTSFSLLESDIHWRDYQLHSGQLDFIDANIFIEEFFGDHSLEIDLQLPEKYGESLRLIVKTDGDLAHLSEADLDVYLQARAINLGQWSSALDMSDLPTVNGVFSGELWLNREDKELSQITLDAVMSRLNVTRKKQGGFSIDSVTGKFDWKKTDRGWYFSSRDIRLKKQAVAWQVPARVNIIRDKEGLSLTATYFRSQDLINIAGVFFDDEQLGIVNTYRLNDFSGDFYNLVVTLPDGDMQKIKFSTTFENLNFYVPGSEILFRGVDGVLTYAEDQSRVELLSETVVMDFGDLFRQPLSADLAEGVVFLQRKDNNWHISSDDFYLLNPDIEINTRLNLVVDNKGALFADIQSNFVNAIGASIRKYYPLPIMSTGLLSWLDRAITDGFVESGSFALHGDLNQFPYVDNDGVMQVVFDVYYLTLNFLEGWPSLNNSSGHVRFNNTSMSISDAGGQTYRGKMLRSNIRIPDFNKPRLFIDGYVDAPAEDLQHYVWNSGLDDILGTAMKQFHASGDTELGLTLEIPMDNNMEEILAYGYLQLNDNELFFPVMSYALKNVSGRLFFDGDQLEAKGVKANFEGAPININISSIDVFSNEQMSVKIPETNAVDGKNIRPEMVFNIKGRLPADGLLKKFEWIPESWVDGASDWDVTVHLPKNTLDYSVFVEMNSNLEGTVISLSDAVSKPGTASLPVNFELKALGNGLQVDVKSKEKFTLFATRNDDNIWDFVVDSALIRGSGNFAEDLNNNSTASLDLEYIDLLTLFKSTNKAGESISLPPTFFPSLNLSTKVLLWNDWKFNDAKLETSWHSHGMLINSINLLGPSLQISGRGSWLTSWQNKHESNFKFFVKSSDLGNTLSALNLSNNMKRCEQTATVDWRWFDEPYRFSWQTVQGVSHFTLKEGEVKALDPGASGRIVGLLNIFKLMDRLTLNFKDVAGEGFSFDSVEGDFDFRDGYASSNNIDVKAAAANMKLKGRIGMVDKDYDLLMQVKPNSSAAAFTGGTLAGGPILGAGLVLINKLLGLEASAYDEYKITGSWDEPKVDKIAERIAEKDLEE